MKVSDYVIDFLIDQELTDIFYTPGGGISHLINSCIDRKIIPILLRHEQAVAFACEGYSRIQGMAVCFVTSGVGSVNALQGVASAYCDKVPFLVISGDMPSIDIISMYRPVTCYATTVHRPKDIKDVLDRALSSAYFYREPVLVNIPGVVQRSKVTDTKYHTRQIQTKPRHKISLEGQKHGKYKNPYLFMKELLDNKDEDTIVVTGVGIEAVATLALKLNTITNKNYGAMGFDIPAAIGVAIASKKKVILVTGDSSIMLNIQELETIHRLKLPIKIYVFDNKGYGAIRRSDSRDFGRINQEVDLDYKFKDKIITYIPIDPYQKLL